MRRQSRKLADVAMRPNIAHSSNTESSGATSYGTAPGSWRQSGVLHFRPDRGVSGTARIMPAASTEASCAATRGRRIGNAAHGVLGQGRLPRSQLRCCDGTERRGRTNDKSARGAKRSNGQPYRARNRGCHTSSASRRRQDKRS